MTEKPEEKKLDVYELVRLIGSGGMGEVYEARHTLIGRRCAIKVLHEVLETNEELLTRMIREAQAASGIGHPNIIEVYDFRKAPSGSYYMVMELLEGESLEELLDRVEILEPDQALVIMSQVLSALRAAHDMGIVHRDLKPDNVFIASNKKGGWDVKVLDFGISKFTDPSSENLKLTKTGAVMGSPYYMSPEQASGKSDINQSADLWACGVMLFEMLSGVVPFPGNNYNEVLANILLKDPPSLSVYRSGMPDSINEILSGSMCRDRSERYKSAEEMIAAISPHLPDGPIDVWGYTLTAQRSDFVKRKSDTGWIKVLHGAKPLKGFTDDDDAESGPGEGEDMERPGDDGSKAKATRLYGAKSSKRTPAGESKKSGALPKETNDPSGKVTSKETPGQAVLPLLPGSPKTTVTSGENISQSLAVLDGNGSDSRRLMIQIVVGLGGLAIMVLGIGFWLFSHGDKDRMEKPSAGTTGTEKPEIEIKEHEKAVDHEDIHAAEAKDLEEKPDEVPAAEPSTEPSTKPSTKDQKEEKSEIDKHAGKETEIDDGKIGVTLKHMPENTRIWLDGRHVEQPIRVRRENRQRCLHFNAPGYQPYTRCFFALEDRIIELRMKRRSARKHTGPKSIYDSPYDM